MGRRERNGKEGKKKNRNKIKKRGTGAVDYLRQTFTSGQTASRRPKGPVPVCFTSFIPLVPFSRINAYLSLNSPTSKTRTMLLDGATGTML